MKFLPRRRSRQRRSWKRVVGIVVEIQTATAIPLSFIHLRNANGMDNWFVLYSVRVNQSIATEREREEGWEYGDEMNICSNFSIRNSIGQFYELSVTGG